MSIEADKYINMATKVMLEAVEKAGGIQKEVDSGTVDKVIELYSKAIDASYNDAELYYKRAMYYLIRGKIHDIGTSQRSYFLDLAIKDFKKTTDCGNTKVNNNEIQLYIKQCETFLRTP